MSSVTIENQSAQAVDIRLIVDISPFRSVILRSTRVKPWAVKTIDGSKYSSRSASTPNLPMVRFFVNGVVQDSFVPEKMVQYCKIIIRKEVGDDTMTIWGVKHRLVDLWLGWLLRGFRFLRPKYNGGPLVLIGLNGPPPLQNAQAWSPLLSSLSPLPTSSPYSALRFNEPAWSPPLSSLSALSTSKLYSALSFNELIKPASSSPSSSLSSLSTLSSNFSTTLDDLSESGISEEEEEELFEENSPHFSQQLPIWNIFEFCE